MNLPDWSVVSPLPEDLAGVLAGSSVRLSPLSGPIAWYPEISSTNDAASALAERGAPEGCIVIADAQTRGRGRLGRVWLSPPGCGLYVSVVLHPPPPVAPLLTLAAGVGLMSGVCAATGLAPALKWPNDLCVGARKLGGILAEAGTTNPNLQYVVLGFGINLRPGGYPPDISARATSLEEELGRFVERGVLLVECLAGLAAQYNALRHGESRRVLDRWRAAAASTLGCPVEWDGVAGPCRGVAEGVDETGALVVRTDAGHARISAGEVRWV